MTNAPELGQRRKINWLNLNTVLSAAILIGAEVFGAAYAGGWAVENLTGLGSIIISIAGWFVSFVGVTLEASQRAGVVLLQVVFFAVGVGVMVAFIRQASRVEPFTSRQ